MGTGIEDSSMGNGAGVGCGSEGWTGQGKAVGKSVGQL